MSPTQAKTVIFLTILFGRGGAETQILRVSRKLKERGWKVQIVSMLTPVGYLDELEAAQIPVHTLSMARGIPDPRALLRLTQYLRQERPDVLTTFCYHANLLGTLSGRVAGVPVIVTSIRNELFGSALREWVERALGVLQLNDAVTTNSEVVARSLVKRRIANEERIEVVPNGIVLQDFETQTESSQPLRAALDIGENDFFWLAVGNLRIQKDYLTLLRAFKELLRDSARGLQLRIAGFGPRESELGAHIRNLGLSSRVRLLGQREDVPRLLQAADGFVLSSAWEGLPNVIMEAMLSKLPVVATNVGGVPELVQDEVTGLLVPPQAPQQLAEAMKTLMNYPDEKRRQMGQRGHDFIAKTFAVDEVTDRWESLFNQLLAAKN